MITNNAVTPVVNDVAASASGSWASGLLGRVYFSRWDERGANQISLLAGRQGDGNATFVAEQLNYRSSTGRLSAFLGDDADTLSTSSAGTRSDLYGIRFGGQIYLEAGTHRFSNTTDDGFRLTINGSVIAQYSSERSEGTTNGSMTVSQAGWYNINIEYFQAYSTARMLIRHSVNNSDYEILGGSDRLRHPTTDGGGTGGGTPTPVVNRAPVATNDAITVNEDGSVTFNPLANDRDPDGDSITLASFLQPASGRVTRNADGTLTYRPNTNFNGQDSFTYTISDGRGGTDQASVGITVRPVNDAPVAGDDSGFAVSVGNSLHILMSNLLANDRDVDGDTLTITGITNVTGGTAMIMGNAIHFTATTAGGGGFDYILSDGRGGTDTGHVNVTVNPANNPGTPPGEDHGGHDGGDDDGDDDDHGGSGGGTGGGSDGGHGGHGTDPGEELITPPRTAAEIQAFVRAVRAEPEDHAHSNDPGMARDHMASLNLVPRAQATHIAVNHGDWNDPATWHNGLVPGDDARVLIPKGIAVTYSEENDASLFTVRVDGHLHFATDQDSRMVVDTFIVAPSGHLEIGTEDDPVQAGVNVDIVFADNGNINTTWDQALLSRGLVSHGAVSIHGAEKTSHLKVTEEAMAGDRQLTLEEVPTGWQVGDKLVLTGTWQQGWYWNNSTRRMEQAESQDEEVTIRAIDGNTITLDRGLTYNHDTPRDDLNAYVANMTRNVTFSSEGGEDLPVHQRGHVMFMHNDDVDVRYAGFDDLGRTDKSRPSGSIDSFGGLGHLQSDTNLQTRYPFHFHETGTSDLENPAKAIGNVVDGSPGWGFVHHSSNADFTNNVAFNVFGAAFVAEDGDETGIWYRNIAIKSEGIGYGDWTVKLDSDVQRDDNGRTGDGYFFAGRLVEAAENVAANTNNGYVWLHRGPRDAVNSDTIQNSDTAYGRDTVGVDTPVIQGFRDNEAFGTNTGIIVIKANPDQGHDVRSVFDGFLNWETREGINLSYTSHYTFLDLDLVGQRAERNGAMNTVHSGISLGNNAFDMVFNGGSITGFQNGFDLSGNNSTLGGTVNRGFLNTAIDIEMSGIRGAQVLQSYAGQLQQLSGEQLVDGRLTFNYTGDRLISQNENIFLTGTKTDSIGSIQRNFAMENQGIWSWNKDAYLAENGYHRLANGTPVLLLTDTISDRATGEITRQTLVFQLDYSAAALARYTNNGVVTLGGPAPVTQADHANTIMNQSVRLNVLANDRDPDGGRIFVDGLTDPGHGDVFLQDDGTVLYRPNHGFTGEDSFSYWARDEEGNFTRGEARVHVMDTTTSLTSDSFIF